MQSELIDQIATALAKAQGEITFASKDALNPHFKSKYADLASIWEACRAPLSRHGLSVVQTMDSPGGQLCLITMLMHSSGQWIRSTLPIVLANTNPQALGSMITYMRRYALSAIVGVAPDDDDDGEKAMVYGGSRSQGGPIVPIPARKVTLAQAKEIEVLLEDCIKDYQDKIWTSLKNGSPSITDLKDLTVDLYTRLKTSIQKQLYLQQEGHATAIA